MRVALLLDRFPVVSETFVTTGAAGLVDAGCDVALVARRRSGESLVHAEVEALDLFARTTFIEGELPLDGLEPLVRTPFEPGRYDVLHAHFGSNARHYLFARKQAEAPLVVSFHGHDFSADPRRHGESMYDLLFRIADVVVYGGEHVRASLVALGCPANKLRMVRVPVDVSAFTFRERHLDPLGPVRFVTVGRLVEKKGHELTLHALAEARNALPPFRYDIVGDGPLAPGLGRLASTLGLADLVHFHGAADSAQVRAVLGDAHVFVLASATARDGDEEGTPLSLSEAQASGLPVVSTRHSGIPEVVCDGRSGILVEPGDANALAAALVEMVAAHDTWPRLGAAGRMHVESTFGVPVSTRQLLAAYDDAHREHAARRREAAVG